MNRFLGAFISMFILFQQLGDCQEHFGYAALVVAPNETFTPAYGTVPLPHQHKHKNISFNKATSTFTIEEEGYYQIDYLMSSPPFFWTIFGVKVNGQVFGHTVIQQNIWQDQIGFPPQILTGITTSLVSETRKIILHLHQGDKVQLCLLQPTNSPTQLFAWKNEEGGYPNLFAYLSLHKL